MQAPYGLEGLVLLERIGDLGNALSSVGTLEFAAPIFRDATEPVVVQAAQQVQNVSKVSMGADGVNHSQRWAQDANGALRVHGKAYLTLVSVLLTRNMSAKCFAPSGPNWLPPILPKAKWRQRALTA